jgi:deoxyadenosine/deoxycytidine kinase
MKGRFVAIEGPTGVGKTTLATRLSVVLDAVAVLDPFDANPFLPRLMADGLAAPPELALQVELTFVALRVAQLRQIRAALMAGRSVVADWALLKQQIFAATTLEPDDAARVDTTVQLWASSLPTPDLLIGLSASATVLADRVRARGRAIESGLTSGQLAALSAAFDAAYTQWTGPLLRVPTDTFDVFDDQHLFTLAEQLGQLPTALQAL